jgi:hypothetical protein
LGIPTLLGLLAGVKGRSRGVDAGARLCESSIRRVEKRTTQNGITYILVTVIVVIVLIYLLMNLL